MIRILYISIYTLHSTLIISGKASNSESSERVRLIVPSKWYGTLAEYSDRLGLKVLDHNYFNRATVGIEDEIHIEIQQRPKPEINKDQEDQKTNQIQDDKSEEYGSEYEDEIPEGVYRRELNIRENVIEGGVGGVTNQTKKNYFNMFGGDDSFEDSESDEVSSKSDKEKEEEKEETQTKQDTPDIQEKEDIQIATETKIQTHKIEQTINTPEKKNLDSPETSKSPEKSVPDLILTNEDKKMLKIKLKTKKKKKGKYDRMFEEKEEIKNTVLDELNATPQKKLKRKPKKNGKKKKRIAQGELQRLRELEKDAEEGRKLDSLIPTRTLMSMGHHIQPMNVRSQGTQAIYSTSPIY